MTLPNFLIIGGPKAGTTSLYDYFRAHPEIFMPSLKEPNFFNFHGQADTFKFPVRSLEAYEALFAGVTTEKAIGEASIHYLHGRPAVMKIKEVLPQVRLIASLRNPVDTSYSVYQMNLRNRGKNRNLSFAEALKEDANLKGEYAGPLARYFAAFSPEQIRIVLFDDLVKNPVGTAQALFRFLEVAPDFVPDVSRVSNPGGVPRVQTLHNLLANRTVRTVARNLFPQALLERARTVRSKNLKKQALTPEERARALALFRDDILRTQDLIGRDLSAWLAA